MISLSICMYVCMYACSDGCIVQYACVCAVRTYVCMNVCMYVCMNVHVGMDVMYVPRLAFCKCVHYSSGSVSRTSAGTYWLFPPPPNRTMRYSKWYDVFPTRIGRINTFPVEYKITVTMATRWCLRIMKMVLLLLMMIVMMMTTINAHIFTRNSQQPTHSYPLCIEARREILAVRFSQKRVKLMPRFWFADISAVSRTYP